MARKFVRYGFCRLRGMNSWTGTVRESINMNKNGRTVPQYISGRLVVVMLQGPNQQKKSQGSVSILPGITKVESQSSTKFAYLKSPLLLSVANG